MTHDSLHWELVLSSSGYRVTRQRSLILDAVCAGDGHTSFGEIYRRVRKTDDSIDRSTVYRALNLFVRVGIVVPADTGGDETYYEVAKPEFHHHLVCRQCNQQWEISDTALKAMFYEINEEYGFHVETDHLVLFGRCESCRESDQMYDKTTMISMLRDEFNRWGELLAGLSDEQITARNLPHDMSIKDVMVHLWAWQQLSIARLEAARHDREPEFQLWPAELEPESVDDGDVDQINAWVYETFKGKPWTGVYQDWRDGFLRFLALSEEIPEADLLDRDRFPWLEGYPLIAVLQGSYEHHHTDHLLPLADWLQQHDS